MPSASSGRAARSSDNGGTPPALFARVTTRPPGNGEFQLDIELEARAGITVLFGPSGAGKSTVLAALAGLFRPDDGRITLGNEVWFDRQAGIHLPPERRGIAFVFQSLALFPHMSARDNVAYALPRALAKRERRRRADELLARMHVAHVAARYPQTLSGGEAQRVALARALAREPRVMLFDEPFSALDRSLRRELCGDLRRLVEEVGVPAIVVTHHRGDVRALGDRMVALSAGRIVAEGGIEEVLEATDDMPPRERA
jgi:molybdate transport system ATP-binding protein